MTNAVTRPIRAVVRSVPALVLLALAAACAPITMVEPSEVREIGKNYSVQPGAAWNDFRGGSHEQWSQNGPLLDALVLVGGLDAGDTLFDDSDDKANMPVWRAGMTESEAAEFVEDSIAQRDLGQVGTANLRPASFGSARGFAFDISFVTKEGLNKRGMAHGAIIDGKLNLILMTAAATYYFDAVRPDVERLIASVRLL